MKSALLYGLIIFILVQHCLAQDYGLVVTGAGMIREDRNQGNADSSAAKRSINMEIPIAVYPNPATDYVWIRISSDYPTHYSASIYDINGIMLFRKDWLTESGSNKYYLSLPSGAQPFPLYIRINGPWNGGARIFRIVKQI